MRILLVEDDTLIASAVQDFLARAGHAVERAASLMAARELRRAVVFDLVLVDLGLPDGSGLDLVAEFRSADDPAAVIVITARDAVADRIVGLNAGADDYLVKPFDLAELNARIAAVVRRAAGRASTAVQIGDLVILPSERVVLRAGAAVDLTAREWSVLEALLHRPGATLSKTQIEDALYSFGDEIESNTVEVFVSRLRRKLGATVIHTVRGLGYRIARP